MTQFEDQVSYRHHCKEHAVNAEMSKVGGTRTQGGGNLLAIDKDRYQGFGEFLKKQCIHLEISMMIIITRLTPSYPLFIVSWARQHLV